MPKETTTDQLPDSNLLFWTLILLVLQPYIKISIVCNPLRRVFSR